MGFPPLDHLTRATGDRDIPGPDDWHRRKLLVIGSCVLVLGLAALCVGVYASLRPSFLIDVVDAASGPRPATTPAAVPPSGPSARPVPPSPSRTAPAPSTTATGAPTAPTASPTSTAPTPTSRPATGPPTTAGPAPSTPVNALALTQAGDRLTASMILGRPYHLHDVATQKCASRLYLRVAQYPCRAADTHQQWSLQLTREAGGAGLYWLRGVGGMCLDVPGYAIAAQGSPLQMAPCPSLDRASRSNDEFQLLHTGGVWHGHREYALVNWVSGLCVDVGFYADDLSDRPSGTKLTLFQCLDPRDGWDDRLWIFD